MQHHGAGASRQACALQDDKYDDPLSSGMKKKSPCATIKGSEIFSGTDALVLAVLLARVQDEGFLLTSHSLSNPTPQCGLLQSTRLSLRIFQRPLKYPEGKAGGLQQATLGCRV